MSGRLSTVYDFSSLRIHPDGSRVQQDSSKNRNLRHAASVAQDFRGNWIARDAGGLGIVQRHRRVREDDTDVDDGEEEVDLDAEREPGQPKGKDKGKMREGMGERKLKPRPAKRQKFMLDFAFLAPASSSSDQQPLPSSDLLKSIHYFASTYYHERGQLMNASKRYRQMRKRNLQRKLEQKRRAEEDGDTDALRPARRGGTIKGAGKKIYPKDMYKILDGSALVAIGMLMQEYVARMLEFRIPDGWEEMVRQAYAEAGVQTLEEAGEEGGDGEGDNEDEEIPGETKECDKDSPTVGKDNVDTVANDDASKNSSANVDVNDGGGRQPREDSEEDDDGDDDESSSEL